MTSDFEGFSHQIVSITFSPILILKKELAFHFFIMSSAKQGRYWYHLYNVLWMRRSLTGGLNPGFPALEPSTLPLGYPGGSNVFSIFCYVVALKKRRYFILTLGVTYSKEYTDRLNPLFYLNLISSHHVTASTTRVSFAFSRSKLTTLQCILIQSWILSTTRNL